MRNVLTLMKDSPDAHTERNAKVKGIQESDVVSSVTPVVGGRGVVKISCTSTRQQAE